MPRLRLTRARDNSRGRKLCLIINVEACVSGSRFGLYPRKESFMLHYSVIFLVVALIAAIFGFGGIASGAVEIAKILFFLFAAMAAVSFLIGLVKKN